MVQLPLPEPAERLTLITCPACEGTGTTATGPIGKHETCRTCWGMRTINAIRHGRYFVLAATGANNATVYGVRWLGKPRETIAQHANLAAAVAAARPATVEEKTGAQVSLLPEAERAAWAFDGVRGDVTGIYVRRTPGHTPQISFGKADVVGQGRR